VDKEEENGLLRRGRVSLCRRKMNLSSDIIRRKGPGKKGEREGTANHNRLLGQKFCSMMYRTRKSGKESKGLRGKRGGQRDLRFRKKLSAHGAPVFYSSNRVR